MKNPALIKGFLKSINALLQKGSGPLKLLLLIILLNGPVVFAQVGVLTDFPDASSAMEIYAINKGLLIPRITLTNSLSNPSPVTSPATGLLVFNSGANQAIGFYYWNGSSWVLIGSGSSSGNYWSITGNGGTTPGTNFLGTTDAKDLLITTNGTERMRVLQTGQVVIDSTAARTATDLFTVFGNSTQKTAIVAYSPGTGFSTKGGRYGLVALVDTAGLDPGYGVYSKNADPLGYGLVSIGSNIAPGGLIGVHTAGISSFGYDGLHAWGKETTGKGYGICAMGSNAAGSFVIPGHVAGVSAVGYDGILSRGSNASGRGIIAVGSGGFNPSISLESEGGAFTGWHGVYANGLNAQGIGVIGVGSGLASYSNIPGGLGGTFSGNYGVYGKGLSTDGIGVVGVGSNGGGYNTVTGGCGGSFTGNHGTLAVGVNATSGIGVIGAGNNGGYSVLTSGAGGSFTGLTIGSGGFGTSLTGGIGVVGAGNNQGAWLPSNGCGGAFTGNTGVFSKSIIPTGTGVVGLGNNLAAPNTFANGAGGAFTGSFAGTVSWATAGTGTAVLGAGNNIAIPLTYPSGSGGAFTGTDAGVVGWGTTAATGVGVIGAGNNVAATLPSSGGAGGSFTGLTWGVYGYATNSGNVTRGGGYFACNPLSGGAYCYAGYRNNNTNYKTLGNGTNSTIVKNTEGELITLYCPEAPEVVFQDYGIGQLVNGFAHITIDPNLAININVSQDHPLKVYITPEGDCMGVFVTNKSVHGFDVIELQGGKSNVPFSWQIAATRANEENVLRDGSIEITVYNQRFGPAPGPLEMTEQPAQTTEINKLEIFQQEKIMSEKGTEKFDQTIEGATLKPTEDTITEITGDPDE